MTALLEWALRYGTAGTLIVPVLGKKPLLDGWQENGSDDTKQISAWWHQWPDANIGGLGGHRWVALDVDGEQGRDELARLEAQHGKLPPTATVASGRDGYGRHYWFACPPSTGYWTPAAGLEVRGTGHQTLLPPSIHPDTGREYVWLDARKPAPAPDWLLASPANGAGRGEHQPPPRPIIAGEGRHPYLKDFAVRLARAGVTDEDRIAAHLQLEFRLSCELSPPPTPGYFQKWARWAAGSRIADRERDLAELTERIRVWREEDR